MKAIYCESKFVQQYSSGSIWGVLVCKDVTTSAVMKVKGTLDRYPVKGDTISFDKYDIEDDPRYGRHYSANLIQVEYPTNPDILPKYLKTSKIINVHGFGDKKLAVLLSDADNVWNVLATNPSDWGDMYKDIPEDIRSKLHANFMAFKDRVREKKTLNMEITLLLTRLGVKFTRLTVSQLVDYINKNTTNVPSIEGFVCDHVLDLIGVISTNQVRQIAEGFGMPNDTLECIDVVDILVQNELSGHTWTPRDNVPQSDDIIQSLISRGKVFQHGKCIFRQKTYDNEGFIADYLKMLHDAEPCLDGFAKELNMFMEHDHRCSAEQKQAVHNAFTHRVSVLTGGPGTGKTSTIRSVLRILNEANKLDKRVVLLAPTGKAVSRITSMLQQDDFDPMSVTLCTLHRLIYATKMQPATISLVIVDEMSMVDVDTFADMLRVLEPHHNIHMVLTGDPDQLPSIGAGNILVDVIKSNVFPSVHLTTIFRQSEGHLMNAIATIRSGVAPKFPKNSPDYVYAGEDPIPVLKKYAAQYKDKPQDLLIITPTNASIRKYETVVRKVFNPSYNRETAFSPGDRVIQCKNVYLDDEDTVNDTPPRFNGMLGTIQHIDVKKTRVVKQDDNGEKRIIEEDMSRVFIEYDNSPNEQTVVSMEDASDELILGYILTIHKSQGSQAETVIVVLDDYGIDGGFTPKFITRNLLYTAVSRAEKRCIVVGTLNTYAYAVDHVTPKRRTCLAKWLRL